MSDNTTYSRDDYRKYYLWANDDQWECIKLLVTLFRGFHHFPTEPKAHGRGICLNFRPYSISTFDFDGLTRLVFLAHDRCIRAEIAGSGPAMIKLVLHKRHTREGGMSLRHPTVETALADWRKHNPLPEEGAA